MHGYEHAASSEEITSVTNVSNKWKDTIIVTIPARGEKEYKLLLDNNATFGYSWETDGADLYFDFHGEPSGDTTGYFKSFLISTKNKSQGSQTSSFVGPHGWYWKNNSDSPVVITLKTNGDYQRLDLGKLETPPLE